MNPRHALAVLTLLFLYVSGVASAQPAATGTSPAQLLIAQKRALVSRVLTDSPLAESVARSAGSVAKAHLTQARQHLIRADAELLQGGVTHADHLLNEAMRQIGAARKLVPDAGSRIDPEQIRYAQLTQSIEMLANSYERNIARRSPWLARLGDEDLQRVKVLLGRAVEFANMGRLNDANLLLVQAQRDMLRSYQALLGAAPLVYDLTFRSPEEEYQYETERWRSYEGLLPTALREFKPPAGSLMMIDLLQDESRQQHARAGEEAKQQQFASAIQIQREAIAKLQQALEATGLVIPKTIPN